MNRAVKLGSAPDSWGVWYADDPQQTPWERFLDEVDAYPGDVEGEGDPIALAEARARTFGWRRKGFLVSTPTIAGELEQRWIKIGPFKVVFLDQPDLPTTLPLLHLLFPQPRVLQIVIQLEIHQQLAAISLGEAGNQAFAVLLDTGDQVAGHAYVDRPVPPVRHDVDEAGFGHCPFCPFIVPRRRPGPRPASAGALLL